MSVSEVVGEVLGVPEPSARFLITLFLAYPFSFAYRLIVAEYPAISKNIFFSMSGLSLMLYVYGFGVWHSVVDVACVYLILKFIGGSLLSVTLTWMITMGHLLAGYVYVMWSDQIHPIAWTIPHCVLVLKLIGLAYNMYDGKRNPARLSEAMKKCAIPSAPSILEVTGFCYFPGSVMAGPQMSFMRYRDFVEGRLFDTRSTPSRVLISEVTVVYMQGLKVVTIYGLLWFGLQTPGVIPGIQRFLTGVFFAILYSVLNQYYPITLLSTQHFSEETFLMKMWLVLICGKVALWRYVTVWLFAEGSCIVTGISYGGIDHQGRVEWHALTNILIIKNELSITLQGVIETFNINTNQWIAMFVFKRLKWLGNRTLSFVITLTFVAIWHGVWPGYYLNFYLEFLCIIAERTFIVSAKRVLGCTLSDLSLPSRLPLTLLAYAAKNVVLVYPVSLFMLLSWENCFMFMRSVHFYGHVVVVGWLLLYYAFIHHMLSSKTKSQ